MGGNLGKALKAVNCLGRILDRTESEWQEAFRPEDFADELARAETAYEQRLRDYLFPVIVARVPRNQVDAQNLWSNTRYEYFKARDLERDDDRDRHLTRRERIEARIRRQYFDELTKAIERVQRDRARKRLWFKRVAQHREQLKQRGLV